jgi:hypothetical protein
VKGFRDLKVWRKSHELTLAIYRGYQRLPAGRTLRVDKPTPARERFRGGQPIGGMRPKRRCRAARFCSIAMGSASELEYHLLLAKDLNLFKPGEYEELAPRATELKRMLTALLQKLSADR